MLANLPNSPIDDALKNRLMGEAYFMRGYWYFYLLKHFGGVPLLINLYSLLNMVKLAGLHYMKLLCK